MLDEGLSDHRPLTLTYSRPAVLWTDALPLGNGRIGAMCFGGIGTDLFQVNDDRCWSGSPASADGTRSVQPDRARESLERARASLFAGDIVTAEREITAVQYGHSQAYQPLLGLHLDTEHVAETTDYSRALDLSSATASHRYRCAGDEVRQHAWISAPAQSLVVRRRIESSSGGRLPTVRIRAESVHPILDRVARATDGDGVGRSVGAIDVVVRMPSEVVPLHEHDEQPVRYDDVPGGAVTAVAGLRVLTDGTVEIDGSSLLVDAATEIVVALCTETDYVGPEVEPLGDVDALLGIVGSRAEAIVDRLVRDGGADALWREHVAAHRALFGRVTLELGEPRPPAPSSPDLGDLLAAQSAGEPDPALIELIFQYGRYLLLSSSRPGTLPANLQGIWNRRRRGPWSSNYTTNINLEMNYWAAEVANLPECHVPLFDWMTAVRHQGETVARELYGARGWVLHHNSDAWGFAWPAGEGDADPCWSFWPMGAVWLCRNVWDHYDFGRDESFLREIGWPLIRDAAMFVLDWLVESPDGGLATSPSTSPENHYLLPGGAEAALTMSSTSDVVVIRDLLERAVDVLDVTGEQGAADADLRLRIVAALHRLPELRTTADGRLAEWAFDVSDADPAHRHTSHLMAAYPMSQISTERRAELIAAVGRTLDSRGPDSTGWALAWRLALRARTGDAHAAQRELGRFLRLVGDDTPEEPSMSGPAGVYRNLFCAHPPFQIDGNFGVCAGIAEMLIQSHRSGHDETVVDLLPACPLSWSAGRFTGLVARGGVSVSARWTGGRLTDVTLECDRARRVRVCGEGTEIIAILEPGVAVTLEWGDRAGVVSAGRAGTSAEMPGQGR